MNSNWRNYIGPGPLVAAAFIGPGTVTVCTLAGVEFGYELLWALALSMGATIILQEMAARIALINQNGLMEVLMQSIKKPFLRLFSLGLILIAIVVGNAAYEAGNISGGAMGIAAIYKFETINLGYMQIDLLNLLIGLLALVLLMLGSYRLIVQYLTALVVLMSLAFLITAILVKPDLGEILKGFKPVIDSDKILTIVALVGTTVVPYNLFLHSSLVVEKWKLPSDLKYLRSDIIISVFLGTLVSISIVITAAAGKAVEVTNAVDLAKSLEPLLGSAATYFIGIGLFAAGVTSAVTAPLAGALVIAGSSGWSTALHGKEMRISMLLIWGLGLGFASLGIRPVELITSAQLANGILLPMLAIYILWLVNQKSKMGIYANKWYWNVIAAGIWLITLVLGLRSIMKVAEMWEFNFPA
jgi:manganese transport protein